ncbi:hypothetical protein HNQ02_003668 [Flavobacterium sp. 7E]|uniref:hypothetical protein n=1 Tax=unclassified Flavobacterium TaxID=196869 RepID=UPI00156D7CC9|nr:MULTISPECIES: hypothetical protein [unclassified Flavobacterium]MBE0393899.1 hypothetical protein [Flavobacterium sp. PL002]NRS90721.1 hypothetical protein [Flavobacterium sp. 7E]
MKYLIYTLLIAIFTSCTSQKKTPKIKETQPLTQLQSLVDTLTIEEKNIVNDFLDIELASERYKSYNNLEIIMIEDAGNGIENLLAYEYAYRDFHSDGNEATAEDNQRLGWILDSIQIKELKNKYSDKKEYHWKSSDIRNFKVNIMKNDTLRNYLKKDRFIELSEKLVLFIKKPIIIDENNAFISITARKGFLFGSVFNNYTTLMKKTNRKWKTGASYWDGSIE